MIAVGSLPSAFRICDRASRPITAIRFFFLAPSSLRIVADLDVGARPGLDPVALPQPRRRDDVALLAVRVVQQRDARRAVRVVLDVRDLGRHAVLVVAPEVDQPVRPLVATALVAGGDLAVDVAAALPCSDAPATSPASTGLSRRSPRRSHRDGRGSSACTCGYPCVSPSARRATEHVDRPALLRERDDSALGVLASLP